MRICCVLVLVVAGCAAQQNTLGISGTLIDPSGALMPNARVTLSGSTTVEIKTDNQGKFMFSILEPGSYKLKFQQAGFKPKTLDVAVDQEPILLPEVLLELVPQPCYGPVVLGNVSLECSGSICGSVHYGSASVTNAIITIQLSGESHRVKTTRTAATGIFQFNDVEPGLYDLIIKAKGFKAAITDSIALQRGSQVKLPPVQLLRPTTVIR